MERINGSFNEFVKLEDVDDMLELYFTTVRLCFILFQWEIILWIYPSIIVRVTLWLPGSSKVLKKFYRQKTNKDRKAKMYTRFYEVLIFNEIVTAFLLLYVDLYIGLCPSSVCLSKKILFDFKGKFRYFWCNLEVPKHWTDFDVFQQYAMRKPRKINSFKNNWWRY